MNRKKGYPFVERPDDRNSESGFTLVEILVVVAVIGIVSISLYGVLSTQNRTFTVQEEVATIQRDAREALLVLEQDIRMAGMGVPRGQNAVSAQQDGTGPGGTDQVTLNHTIGPITFLTNDTVTLPGNDLQVDSVTDFAVGDSVNLIDLENNNLIGNYTIDGITTATKVISLTATPAGIAVGSLMAKAFKTITYSVITNNATGRQELHRTDGAADSILVDGLQDFQLTYTLSDGTTSTAPADLSTIRKIQISLIAETHRAVSNQANQTRSRQLITTVALKNVRA